MRLTPSRIVYVFLSVIVFILVLQSLHTITNGYFHDTASSIPMVLLILTYFMSHFILCKKITFDGEGGNRAENGPEVKTGCQNVCQIQHPTQFHQHSRLFDSASASAAV